MAANRKYEYYETIIRKAEQILEFKLVEVFADYAARNGIRQILVTRDPDTQEPSFAFTSKGALYICHTQGYKNLEDIQQAIENKFPDAETFYDAMERNCSTYADYVTAVEHGIEDSEVFGEMKTAGYVDGYSRFDEQRQEDSSLPKLEDVTNVKELFDYAKSKSFTDFAHFITVWQAGFADPLEHKMAMEKGLNNSADFEVFKKGGFNTLQEYQLAKPLSITSLEELHQYVDLNLSAYEESSFDELLLISIVSKLPNGSKTDFTKLYNYFLKQEEKYKYPNEKGELKYRKWYTKRMRNEQDVKDFLAGSDKVKLFGTFDASKDLFETIHVKRRKVVVDGSNVAYNSNMADRKRGAYGAEMKNILSVVKKLKKEYGFEDIYVISDANLIHKVKDKEVLKDIKALCKYSESTSGTPADLYLINHVKKHHCLLVTNDTFKDWKMTDKWVEDNIDFYR